jgi:ABC-type glycerol-3-phosphate transport system permease component
MKGDEIVLARGPGFYTARAFIYASLLFVAAVYLFPLVVVILTSLKDRVNSIATRQPFASGLEGGLVQRLRRTSMHGAFRVLRELLRHGDPRRPDFDRNRRR